MKIALIGPVPPPNGGMAMQSEQLRQLLCDAGHDVSFIATNQPYRPQWVGRIVMIRAFFRLIGYCWSLPRQLKQQQVVHLMANSGWSFYLFAMPAIYIASWYKIPIVMNYRGGNAREFFARSWPLIKGAFARVDKVVVPSEFLDQIFNDYNIGTQVVANIVDLSIFRYKKPELSRVPLHIVVTRNLEAIYDNVTAIRGFSLYHQDNPHSKLTIAGSGEEELKLRQLTQELGLVNNVSFVGRLTRKEIALLYQSADILLNTSLIDNTPNSIIEALACGVIVISSNVGGIPYLVEDGRQALLVDPGRAGLIARRLSDVVADHELSLRLSDNGYKLVQRFSSSNVLPLLEGIYHKLVHDA